MKLKTLKDLQKDYEWKFDTYNALRQEAIKWIKELEKNITPSLYGQGQEGDFMEAHYNIAKIEWIKHFFNLTEEDLK